MSSAPATSRTTLLLAFAAIYLIWGSTYLAIRVAVESMPPFAMAGARFIVAGVLLYSWLAWKGRARATPQQWRDNFIAGTLLLLGGNAVVVWAEQKIPSGITTLLISLSPLYMVLIDWALPQGKRPTWATVAGLALGFGGVAYLISGQTADGGTLDPWRCLGLLVSSLFWAAGSLFSRYARNPAEPLTAAALQMLTGGVLMLVVGLLRGEATGFHFHAVPARSVVAWGYLVVAGSLVAYPAYVYLLKHSTPARVSTYSYVNPVVAVFLGWLIMGEPVGPRTFLAATIIVVAVAIITTQRAKSAVKKA